MKILTFFNGLFQHEQNIATDINPANGLPLIDGVIDVCGNVFGNSGDDGLDYGGPGVVDVDVQSSLFD